MSGFFPNVETTHVVATPPVLPPSDWVAPKLSDLPEFSRASRIAIDCETYDPDLKTLGPGVRRTGYVVGISIGIDDGPRWYLPLRHEGGNNMDNPDQVVNWVRDQFMRFKGDVVGTNLMYDLDYLAEIGCQFNHSDVRYMDVSIAEPLLNEHKFRYSLDSISKEHLGEPKVEELMIQAAHAMKIKDVKANIWRLPARFVGPYATADVDLPLRILPIQLQKLEDEELMRVWDLECRLIPVLFEMRRRGVRVDLKKAEQVLIKLQNLENEQLHRAKLACGKEIQLYVSAQLGPLIEARGYTLPRTEKKQEYQIKSEWLKSHAGEDPLIESIYLARKFYKARTTFIEGHIFKQHIGGRVHAQYHQVKGDSDKGNDRKRGTPGRLSSSDPNLQNIPSRDSMLGPLIRSIFLPEEREVYERHDWSQIEYRFLAHYARGRGASEMREAYNNDPNTDFHKKCAVMAGIDPEDSYKRKQVKNVNFGAVYGSGKKTTAETMGVSIEEAEAFLNLYHSKLPFVKKTFKAVSAKADETGFIHTIMGRRSRFPLWEPADWDQYGDPLPYKQALKQYGKIKRAKTYKATNSLFQNNAADLMKLAMVKQYEDGVHDVLGAPLLTVHDELGQSRPQTPEGEKAIQHIKHVMETCMELRVPIIAERESGKNWGECK